MSDIYSIGASRLAFCKAVWNPKTKKYENDNSMNTIQCCMNKCDDYLSFCYEQCGNNQDCVQRCDELSSNCANTCIDYDSEGIGIISECAVNEGCSSYPTLNKECMMKNRDKIIKCCKEGCIPTMTVDCGEQCQDFFYNLTHGIEKNLQKIKSDLTLGIQKKKSKDKNITNLLFFIIVLSLFIVTMNIIL